MSEARAKKIDALLPTTSITPNTIFVVVQNPNTNAATTNTVTLAILANTVIGQNTPANSSITVTQGQIYYDNTYIYIATSNNVLKRVTLEQF